MKTKKNIELLIDILENSKINSLEVSSFWGFKKIKLSRGTSLKSSTVTPEVSPEIKENMSSPRKFYHHS